MKAAKQLRRGKRITEIEDRFGKNVISIAIGSSQSPTPHNKAGSIPELAPEFFESPFFRRFQVQRKSSLVLDAWQLISQALS
jgi:hypothetical protein